MRKLIDLTIGLIAGFLFSIGILLILTLFFVVLITFILYFTVREVLKHLTTNK